MFPAHRLGIIETHLLSKKRPLRVEVTFEESLWNLFCPWVLGGAMAIEIPELALFVAF